ncbi:hypothetical protein M977_00427 [Buttiauxella gaviniae ATCC 51604]|uniref:Uncharacterized protein n=1 Tax=Buttiauxella gaviniae ATCC 51604 TaxID=1354253 RepID=A0A1B7I520_9ENTR|nr:hypothetical protein M977_00427 [Buttiauxella gaviniae ATCC 51604]
MCSLPFAFYALPTTFLMLLMVSIALNACMLWARYKNK